MSCTHRTNPIHLIQRSLLLTVLLLGSLGISEDATAQSRTRFLQWSYQDAGPYLKSTSRSLPYIAAGGAALMLAGPQIDIPILNGVQRSYGGSWGSFLNMTNELGGPRALLPVAGLFAVSLSTKNSKFQDAAFTSFQSLIYAGFMSYGVKMVAGRHRPYEGFGSNEFVPFSGKSSFPSGHTAAAFAIITPWVYYYPGPLTYGLFALSTGTAIARIAHDKHWPTDVLAGAAVGFFTGRYLARRHQAAVKPGKVSIIPQFGLQSAGVTIKF